MIKRFLIFIGLILLISPLFAFASYQQSSVVTATDVSEGLNNFLLIQKNGEKWLLHHKTGCGPVQEGDTLTLVAQGELDGNQDTLWNGTYKNCVVDQAELITDTLRVTTVSASDTYTSVSDNGTPYRIYYSERCKAAANMKGKDLYVQKFGGKKLQAGDKFFLPGNGEACGITYVQPEGVAPPEPKVPEGDVKRPTTPTRFKAVASNGAVYLSWNPAKDNEEIAYYIISASQFHMDDAVAQDPAIKPEVMPDTVKTDSNKSSIKLTDLESDREYYFRIIAVDTSGNESSYWSEETKATPKSSIAKTSLKNDLLKVSLKQKKDDSVLFEWNKIPGSLYSVIVEANKERVLTRDDWTKNFFRIVKKPSWKGKKMTFTVHSLDVKGIYQEDKVNFEF